MNKCKPTRRWVIQTGIGTLKELDVNTWYNYDLIKYVNGRIEYYLTDFKYPNYPGGSYNRGKF